MRACPRSGFSRWLAELPGDQHRRCAGSRDHGLRYLRPPPAVLGDHAAARGRWAPGDGLSALPAPGSGQRRVTMSPALPTAPCRAPAASMPTPPSSPRGADRPASPAGSPSHRLRRRPPRGALLKGAPPSKPTSGRRPSASLDRVSSPVTSTEPSSTSAANFDPPSATPSPSSRPPASRWCSPPGARPGPGSRTLPRALVLRVPRSRCRGRSCRSRRPVRSIACVPSRPACTSRRFGSPASLASTPWSPSSTGIGLSASRTEWTSSCRPWRKGVTFTT